LPRPSLVDGVGFAAWDADFSNAAIDSATFDGADLD